MIDTGHEIIFANDPNLTTTICSFKMQQDTSGKTLSFSQMINNETFTNMPRREKIIIKINVNYTTIHLLHHEQRYFNSFIPKSELNGFPKKEYISSVFLV